MKNDFNKACRRFAQALEQIDTEKLFLQSAKENSELALDLNRLQLVAEGKDSKGKSLGQYAPSTKKKKQAKGQDTSHITLLDEGYWQEKLFLDTKQLPIFIDSSDSKNGYLKGRFGPDITGLNMENQKEFKDVVAKTYKDKVGKTIENLADKILR